MKELIDEIMEKFKDFTSGVRVMMLIDRGVQNNNKGSKRWVNKLISFNSGTFEKNLSKLIELQYYLKNPDIRLYTCVNDRKLDSAIKYFQHKQIDINDEAEKISFYTHINDNFCSALMQTENKRSRLFLIDIDQKNTNEVDSMLNHDNILPILKYETKKGWHYITNSFDPKILCLCSFAEVKKDGLILINWINI